MCYDHTSVGHVVPGADSRVVFTGEGGLYSDELKAIQRTRPEKPFSLPSAASSYYFDLSHSQSAGDARTPGPGVAPWCNVYAVGNSSPLFSIGRLDEMSTEGEAFAKNDFTADKRYLFLPSARLFVTIPRSDDRLVLRRVDVIESLQKSGANYLFITSSSPRVASWRHPNSYQITAESRKGGLKFELNAGPKGMAVSPEGKVTWVVPAEHDGSRPTTVIISITDASGQVILHTFDLRVDPPPGPQQRRRSGPRRLSQAIRQHLEKIRDGHFIKPQVSSTPVSYLCAISSPGDYIGQGGAYCYEKEEMKVRRTDRGVGITVGDVGGWKILFGGGRGGSLEAGKYLNARRYPFSGDAPGIEFTGYGRGCNTITGRFVVWEFETEQSGSLRLAIDFQQRCEDKGPPLCGAIRYNSTFR